MGRFGGLFEMARVINAVAAGVLTALGAFVAGEGMVGPVGAAVAATIVATAAGNMINDYFDREVDQVNAPERPLPRGAVSPRTTLGVSLALFAVAFAITLTLPLAAVAIAVVNLAALISYTSVFKGLPGAGNVVVGLLVGSTFPFGAAASGGIDPTIGVLFALAAVATVTREIVKDVEDIDGDRTAGLRTLPIAVGRRRALWIGTGLLVAAIGMSPAPYFFAEFGWPYLVALVPAIVVMGSGAARSFTDPTTGQQLLKYGMFLAVGAFVVGRLAVLA